MPAVEVEGTPATNSEDAENVRKKCINSAQGISSRVRSLNEGSVRIRVPWCAYESAGSYDIDYDWDRLGRHYYPATRSSGEMQFDCLHLAARAGDRELVEFLLAHGADVNGHDSDRQTPLYHVLRGSHSREIAELLLAHGADVNDRDRYELTMLDLVKKWNGELADLLRQHGAHESK